MTHTDTQGSDKGGVARTQKKKKKKIRSVYFFALYECISQSVGYA